VAQTLPKGFHPAVRFSPWRFPEPRLALALALCLPSSHSVRGPGPKPSERAQRHLYDIV